LNRVNLLTRELTHYLDLGSLNRTMSQVCEQRRCTTTIKIEDWNNGQDCGVGRGWFRAWIGLLINKCLTSNQHWLEKYKRKTFTCTLNRPFLFLFWFWLYFKVLILSLPVRPTIFWLQIFKFGEHFMGKKIILIIRDQNK
jgi:hypothetical protein